MQYPFQQQQARTQAATYDEGLRSYMLGIYNYMASGLALTGIVAWLTASSETMLALIFGTPLQWLLIGAMLVYAFFVIPRMDRMSLVGAQATFWSYATILGLLLSSYFVVYTGVSLARVFFITAITFGATSLYGYTTKRDLTGFRSFLMIGMIGVFIAIVVNWFLQSPLLMYAYSVIGVLVFAGLTAFETQQMKAVYYQFGSNPNIAIRGALLLYMSFLNIFIFLMNLFGQRE